MIEEIKEIIKKATGVEKDFQVLFSERAEFGNYSTNIPFLLVKELKKSPMEIAKELAEKIVLQQAQEQKKLFSKVEAAAPGYVNFWLSPETLIKELERVLKAKNYKAPPIGRQIKAKSLKINIEFISANPTGPLTMANGRGGFLGDVLGNILEAVGHKVVREYYINDAGNQIRLLGESILAALGKISAKEEHYKGEYIKILAEKLKLKILRQAQDDGAESIGRLVAAELLKQIKKSVGNVGIKFNVWYSEYENLRGEKGLIKKVLAILEKGGLVEKKEGAVWLKTSDISEDKDRVLIKSDGQPTYFLADLAYHYDKL